MKRTVTCSIGPYWERGDLLRMNGGLFIVTATNDDCTQLNVRPVRWWDRFWWANRRQWRILVGRFPLGLSYIWTNPQT